MAKEICDRCGELMSDDGGCWCGIQLTYPRPTLLEAKDAEITRLKEQLARTERERDQAIEVTELEECDKTEYPELYEHLWHLAELRNDLRSMRGE